MAGRIVVFGATGYTGGLIAERLVAAGEEPVLAGRDTERLARVAERLGGGAEVAKADALRQNSVFSLVEAGDVLISTVGPFTKYGAVAVRAAIAAGAVYLDSTGEPAFIRRIFEEFAEPAAKSGAALLTAQGYDWVPGALAAALALEDAGPAAVRVDVGYFTKNASASTGTKESLVGATLDPGFAYRGGRIVTERGAARVRSFPGAGAAFSAGGAEHFTLPMAYPRLREVNTYLGVVGPLARGVQLFGAATALAQRGVSGGVVRAVMQAAGERMVNLLPDRSDARATSRIVATAHNVHGAEIGRTTLDGPDPYDFTATFMAWAARRATGGGVQGTGALSPLIAYGGLAGLHEGCAAAGISERP
ncbi:MAG: hypothetical protein QOI80_178 [Solirubrobacteraceae bacterium]|jgi:short subunit dehydrogenase-like uncharacterized protein|nr:hypothetical protein [Solirubrobacteraceae bacterium]